VYDARRVEYPAGASAPLSACTNCILHIDADTVRLEADGFRIGVLPRPARASRALYLTISGWSGDGQAVRGAFDWVDVAR